MYLEERVEYMEKVIENLQLEIKRLEARSAEEILTPKEFAKKSKLNENTVYGWIREGRIKILPNLGTALRIPMSQFYEEQGKTVQEKQVKRRSTKSERLKKEFLSSLNESA